MPVRVRSSTVVTRARMHRMMRQEAKGLSYSWKTVVAES